MVTYSTNPATPGKSYFSCEKMRAVISTTSCAEMWRRADGLDDGVCNACRLCPIGAVHAGEVAASMSPLKGTLTCSRCHRVSRRLIGGEHCPSCYNRGREWACGRNAKGTSPVKLASLDARCVHFMRDGEVRTRRMRQTLDADELIVSVLRDSKHTVIFSANTAPPAAIAQARLW